MGRTLARLAPLAGVVVLLGVVAAAASMSDPRVTRVPVVPSPTPHAPPSGGSAAASAAAASAAASAPAPGQVELPPWVGTVAVTLLAAAALAVLLTVAWFLVRDSVSIRKGALDVRQPVAGPSVRREDVLAAVDAGLTDLADDDADPRRAVIACWVRLEQAAAEAGTPRLAGDAPGDLVARLLAEQRVSGAALADLAEVYRVARYASAHTVDAGMRDRARSALGRLRAELAAGPVGVAP